MPLKIVCVGKHKGSPIQELIDDFSKRIRPFTDITLTVLPDTALTKTNNTEIVINKESGKILKYLDGLGKRAYTVILDKDGKMFDTMSFTEVMRTKLAENELLFIIGGVYGLSPEIKQRADLLLSLSPLTFTHQLARIILLEQIYRGLTIINNRKYHY